MNDKDLHKLLSELSGPSTPKLPAHQKALRARLLKAHANQQTLPRRLLGTFAFITTNVGVSMNKKSITIGVSALAISVLAIGIMTLGGPQNSVSAAELIAGAKKSAQAMDPAKLAAFNEKNQQDLNQRLAEAKDSSSLKVMSLSDLTKLGWEPKPYGDTISSYVGYVDNNNHNIVFGLGENELPVFVLDVTTEVELRKQAEERLKNPQPGDPRSPSMQVN